MIKIKSFVKITLLFLFVLTFSSSCRALFGTEAGPMEVFISGDYFMIAWDHRSAEYVYEEENTSYFKVYYREHGTLKWKFLSDYPHEEEPQFLISRNLLNFGVYDFGVSYVNKKGFESPMHSSLEVTASPVVGWYVNWSSK